MTTATLHRTSPTLAPHRAARNFSKASWSVLMTLALLIVALVAAQASGVLTLNKVLTGSMEPTIMTGDYVLERQPSGDDLARGVVLTYSNTAAYDGLSITHRVVAVSDGRAVMRGDNNPGADPYAIAESDVQGVVIGHVSGTGARVIEQFIPVPQWRTDLAAVIHDSEHSRWSDLLRETPWGLVATFVLLLLAAGTDRLIIRRRA